MSGLVLGGGAGVHAQQRAGSYTSQPLWDYGVNPGSDSDTEDLDSFARGGTSLRSGRARGFTRTAIGFNRADLVFGQGRTASDPYAAYRRSPCERDPSRPGATIGALGAKSVDQPLARRAGAGAAVLGAKVGDAVEVLELRGAPISAACDAAGYYFTPEQTFEYREQTGRNARATQDSSRLYTARGCRLAVVPAATSAGAENRYARVCPDQLGRYRLTPRQEG